MKSVDTWTIRNRLKNKLGITVKAIDILDRPSGFSIFIDSKIFTVLPPEGDTQIELADDIIFQLKEKYPEVLL